jgi:DNA-binding transcriptional ArsR family regulator
LAQPDARDRVEEADRVFSALAHPSRRHILLTLNFRGGEMSAGDIAERFGCSWPTTTRHLNLLREAGLVSVVRRGRERLYVLERGRLRGLVGDWLNWFGEEKGSEQHR